MMKVERSTSIYTADGHLERWVEPNEFMQMVSAGVLGRVIQNRKGFVKRAYLRSGFGVMTEATTQTRGALKSVWSESSIASDRSRRSAEYRKSASVAVGSHTEAEWQERIRSTGNKCLRCQASGNDVKLTKDHIMPLSEGGTDNAVNLQPLCLQCNSWKGNRDIDYSRATSVV